MRGECTWHVEGQDDGLLEQSLGFAEARDGVEGDVGVQRHDVSLRACTSSQLDTSVLLSVCAQSLKPYGSACIRP